MTQKTISLTERAYELLRREKKKGESFSRVIERLISKKENPWLLMRDKFDPELWEGLKKDIGRLRDQNLTGGNNFD